MIQFNPLTKLPLLALLLAVTGSTSSWAQSNEDIRLEREARLAVYKNVNLYSSNASVKPGESDGFFGLFSDNSALHVVDFPMFNNVRKGESVPVNEYVQKYQSLFKQETRAMSLSLKHMTYVRSPSHLEIRASVTKEFKGATTENGWKFEDPIFERTLEIVWRCNNFQDLLNHWENPMDSNGRKKKKPKLEFRIHEVTWHPSQHEKWVMLVNEGGLQAETCGEPEIIRGSQPDMAIYVSESPIWVIRDTTGSNSDTKLEVPVFGLGDSPSTILGAQSFEDEAKTSPMSWSLGIGTSTGMLGQVNSEHAENIAARSPLGASLTASLGWTLLRTSDKIVDVWLGAGASTQRHQLSAERVYFEEVDIDPDYFSYLRQTRGTEWNETLSESLGNLSLGLRYLKRIASDPSQPIAFFGMSSGVTYAVQASTSFDNSSTVVRQGYYEDLFGITIDENGIYDFGTFTASGESSNTSWSSAIAVPIHAVYARKRDALTPWMTWVQVGPSLHYRTGKPSEEGPFVSNSQLRSAFLESNRYSFVNLDVQFGIRKRIGWTTIDPCDPQP